MQIETLMSVGAKNAAIDWFTHGYNVMVDGKLQSLEGLATSPSRTSVKGQFDLFQTSFDDSSYAKSIIVQALVAQQVWNGQPLTDSQAIVAVSGAIRYMILYMGVLDRLHHAVDVCKTEKHPEHYVDEAAALFVGSIEGDKEDGKHSGRSLFAISKRLCEKFSTCGKTKRNSKANTKILKGMTVMVDSLQRKECDAAAAVLSDGIEPALVSILLQGSLFMAFKVLAVSETLQNPEMARADAYLFSLSVLPLIRHVDQEAAAKFATRMELGYDHVPKDNFITLEAIATIVANMDVPALKDHCDLMGTFFGKTFADDCAGESSDGPESLSSSSPSENEQLNGKDGQPTVLDGVDYDDEDETIADLRNKLEQRNENGSGGVILVALLGIFLMGMFVGLVSTVAVPLYHQWEATRQNNRSDDENFDLITTREGLEML